MHAMKTKNLILMLALALLVAAAGLVSADADDVARPRWVLSGGATDAAGGDGITLRASLGQPIVGVVASGDEAITLGQGFWHGGALDGVTVFLPVVLRATP
jgi:hypothetical protein